MIGSLDRWASKLVNNIVGSLSKKSREPRQVGKYVGRYTS
jgi:hypothetical protein